MDRYSPDYWSWQSPASNGESEEVKTSGNVMKGKAVGAQTAGPSKTFVHGVVSTPFLLYLL